MTDDDELRARLRRIDPVAPDTALDPSPSPRARQLLERAMTDTTETTAAPSAPPRRSRLPIVAAAAAAVAALAIGGVMLSGGDSPTAKPKPKSTLALNLPAAATHPGGPSMNSCIRFDVSILKDMETAFSGTVSAVGDSSVTLDVDHWYTGGSADVVTLSQPDASGPVSLEGGVTFEQGKRYFVTATNGTVNGCGYTGEASADLEQAFQQAFPG